MPSPSAQFPCLDCGKEIPQDLVAALRTRGSQPRLWKCIPCTRAEAANRYKLHKRRSNVVSHEPGAPTELPPQATPPQEAASVSGYPPAAPTPAASSSQASAADSAAAAAATPAPLPLDLFLAGREEAIINAQAAVAQLEADKKEAEDRLADLQSRFTYATSEGGPAAELMLAAQIRSGLVAARKRELFLFSSQLVETQAICTALENQHANAEVDAVAACDNCLAPISAAQLIACRPGPRSDALMHCPACAVNPRLH